MQILNKIEKKLAKFILEWNKIKWEEYLNRFENYRPLKLRTTQYDTLRLAPEEVECNINLLSMVRAIELYLINLQQCLKLLQASKRKLVKKR